jgi:hypothetical protein
MTRKQIVRSLILVLVVLVTVWSSMPFGGTRYPVTGTLAGQPVKTTVDSELAAHYLEHYLRGERSSDEHDREIDRVLKELNPHPSDRDALRLLSERVSTDFATIHFAARVYEGPANRRAQEAFHELVEKVRASRLTTALLPPAVRESYLIAFVPGYAYKKDRTTGADFARQRELLRDGGVQTLLIETDELGTVEDNAKIVADAISHLRQEPKKVIIVSASKGGPETALALGQLLPPEAGTHVRAWISVGGLLKGSPYADQALRWPKRWLAGIVLTFQGLRTSVIKNLSTEVRTAAFGRLRFPPHLLTLQYVGVPLSGDIGTATRGRYHALRALGPNDGLTLLADELVPDGIVVTDVGLDHYYRDPHIDLKTVALAGVVIDELERRETRSIQQNHEYVKDVSGP